MLAFRTPLLALGTTALAALLLVLPAGRADDKPADAGDVRMVPPDGDGGKYWPRWRGPSGQGLVPDGNYPDTWSDTQNVIWRIEPPGRGNSSPIIWKDKIFLTTAHDAGKKRAILCLSRADGKVLWETPAPDAKPEP